MSWVCAHPDFSSIPDNSFSTEIFADGYHPVEKSFTVNEGTITNLNIQLVPIGAVSTAGDGDGATTGLPQDEQHVVIITNPVDYREKNDSIRIAAMTNNNQNYQTSGSNPCSHPKCSNKSSGLTRLLLLLFPTLSTSAALFSPSPFNFS